MVYDETKYRPCRNQYEHETYGRTGNWTVGKDEISQEQK